MLKRLYPVDDDAAIRASMLSVFAYDSDIAVQCFPSGDDFIDQSLDLEPGVILLDMNMPGSSGIDILYRLLEQHDKFVPIIISGEASVPLAVRAMRAGAVDLLEKPCAPAALIRAIDGAFDQLDARCKAARQVRQCRDKIARLSSRERDVLKGLLGGLSNKGIGRSLDISPRTVEIYRANMMKKLEIRTLAEAVHIALEARLDAEL